MTQTVTAPEAPRAVPAVGDADAASLPQTPYKGLSFYSEEDAPFFFGRGSQTQIVTANLMASRLTLLYGESGVGKSSLLRAGVARELHDLARENIRRRRGRANVVVALFPHDDEGGTRASWSDEPIGSIATAIERAVASLGLDVEVPSRSLPFCELLAAWTELLGSDLLIVLDQFEEYLLYHEGEEGVGTLAHELPRALALPNLRVSFLISIREDALARLDRFKGRIPTLFDNYLRINHLDQKGAREAIVKPIEKWNELSGEEIEIEPKLVETLLHELETGRVSLGLVGAGISEAQAQARESQGERLVETPYLQLVMTRLWKEERRVGSTRIRLATLNRLGGCARIVRTHLDGTMKTLQPYARTVAAQVFHHLVTPSGTKIAHNARDLADYVRLDEADVDAVLDQLTAGDSRILRRVGGAEGDEGPPRYEIFHDVLGAAILDWRARYLRARDVVYSIRRGATGVFQAAVGIACLWALLFVQYGSDYTGRRQDFFLLWAATALAMWVVATVVLVRRWRRRAAWVVPLVGAVVAVMGPVTATIAAANGSVRLWRLGARRLGRGRDQPEASRARPSAARSPEHRRRRFSGLMAIAGAAIVVAACVLPSVLYDYTWWSVDYEDFESRQNSYSLVAADDRLWFAMAPLLAAGIVAAVGLLLVGGATRKVSAGLLAGLGTGAFAYFVGYMAAGDVLRPLFPESASFPVVDEYFDATLRGGTYLGAAGAALIVIAGAPGAVAELFATMIGAGRILRGAAEQRAVLRTSPEDRARRRRRAAGVLALVGAVVAAVACFVPSAAWYRDRGDSLVDVSNGAAFQALAPALVAAVLAVAMVVRPPDPGLAAGLLAGLGCAVVVLFGGLTGAALAEYGRDIPAGGYVGIAGGVLMIAAGALALRGERVETRVALPERARAEAAAAAP